MTLPIVTLPSQERWECHRCGYCCRGTIVPLSGDDQQKLVRQGWDRHPEMQGITVVVSGGGQKQLARRANGDCVFLAADGGCRIHQEFGAAAKPLICRLFPLQLVPQEKRAVLTLRRACPTAAADQGRELGSYLDEVRKLAREGKLAQQAPPSPIIKPGEIADWSRAQVAIDALARLTADSRFPLIRRLAHGLEFCRLLEQANTTKLNTVDLAEWVGLLEQQLPEVASAHFGERIPPCRWARTLFRQIALEWIRLHPRFGMEGSLRARIQLVGWAAKMAWGRGKLPRIHPQLPPATFDMLEKPLDPLEAQAYQQLARYFETTTASAQFALANRHRWSIVESYRQLALMHPLALWLLRWTRVKNRQGDSQAADGMMQNESLATDNLLDLIVAIDRAQGYEGFAGRRQRSRLKSLARLGQLPVLVAWYGR